MKLAVVANDQLKDEFLSKQVPAYHDLIFIQNPEYIPGDADIVFDLLFNDTTERISLLKPFLPRPVFINAVTTTLATINEPFIRINAWPTFLKRSIVEIAAMPAQQVLVEDVFKNLGWKYFLVPDITGMVSPRITAAIINEAYYTLAEEVSTKDEIDIAMKLGTNYPFGPFEWSKKIGLQNVYDTLDQLSKENDAYKVATLLTNEIII